MTDLATLGMGNPLRNVSNLIEEFDAFESFLNSFTGGGKYGNENEIYKFTKSFKRAIWPPGSTFYEARAGVCVVGFNRECNQVVKQQVNQLGLEPFALESFHVKSLSDIKDGAFLVPKIILVASHCPGKKLLDEENDEGQLDFLYDEACEVGADIMVVYMNLPPSIYSKDRRSIYHPRFAELVLTEQPLLRYLAEEKCLMTINEGEHMSARQKNLLREWVEQPVSRDHPVFKTADYLSTTECDTDFYSEVENTREDYYQFRPATEEHPILEKKKSKKKKKKSKKYTLPFRRREERSEAMNQCLIQLDERDETVMEMEYINSSYQPI